MIRNRELHPDNVAAFAFTLFTSRNKQNVNKNYYALLHSFIIVIISHCFSFFKIVRSKVLMINYKLTLFLPLMHSNWKTLSLFFTAKIAMNGPK